MNVNPTYDPYRENRDLESVERRKPSKLKVYLLTAGLLGALALDMCASETLEKEVDYQIEQVE